MNPVAFSIGPLDVLWYSIMAAVAMVSCFYLGRFWAVRFGVDGEKYDILGFIFMPVVILGGRTAYVLNNLSYYLQYPGEILRVDHGGLGSHGAVAAVIVAGVIGTRALKVRFWDMADAMSPAMPLSFLLIRIGNFANGELYGMPTSLPWGMVFPGTYVPHHPSMLYEAVGDLLILLFTLRWLAGRTRPGHPFLKTMTLMSLLRVLVDFTRTGTGGPLLGLSLTQALSLVMLAVSLSLLRRPGSPPKIGSPRFSSPVK